MTWTPNERYVVEAYTPKRGWHSTVTTHNSPVQAASWAKTNVRGEWRIRKISHGSGS